jgi:hypothetical protein
MQLSRLADAFAKGGSPLIKDIAQSAHAAVESARAHQKDLEGDFVRHMDAFKELVAYLQGLPTNTKVCPTCALTMSCSG